MLGPQGCPKTRTMSLYPCGRYGTPAEEWSCVHPPMCPAMAVSGASKTTEATPATAPLARHRTRGPGPRPPSGCDGPSNDTTCSHLLRSSRRRREPAFELDDATLRRDQGKSIPRTGVFTGTAGEFASTKLLRGRFGLPENGLSRGQPG